MKLKFSYGIEKHSFGLGYGLPNPKNLRYPFRYGRGDYRKVYRFEYDPREQLYAEQIGERLYHDLEDIYSPIRIKTLYHDLEDIYSPIRIKTLYHDLEDIYSPIRIKTLYHDLEGMMDEKMQVLDKLPHHIHIPTVYILSKVIHRVFYDLKEEQFFNHSMAQINTLQQIFFDRVKKQIEKEIPGEMFSIRSRLLSASNIDLFSRKKKGIDKLSDYDMAAYTKEIIPFELSILDILLRHLDFSINIEQLQRLHNKGQSIAVDCLNLQYVREIKNDKNSLVSPAVESPIQRAFKHGLFINIPDQFLNRRATAYLAIEGLKFFADRNIYHEVDTSEIDGFGRVFEDIRAEQNIFRLEEMKRGILKSPQEQVFEETERWLNKEGETLLDEIERELLQEHDQYLDKWLNMRQEKDSTIMQRDITKFFITAVKISMLDKSKDFRIDSVVDQLERNKNKDMRTQNTEKQLKRVAIRNILTEFVTLIDERVQQIKELSTDIETIGEEIELDRQTKVNIILDDLYSILDRESWIDLKIVDSCMELVKQYFREILAVGDLGMDKFKELIKSGADIDLYLFKELIHETASIEFDKWLPLYQEEDQALEMYKRLWFLKHTEPHDLMILHNTDYPYKDKPVTVEPYTPNWDVYYWHYDINKTEIDSHPVPFGGALGSVEIPVSIEIMIDFINILLLMWAKFWLAFTGWMGSQAVIGITNVVYNWLQLETSLLTMNEKGSRDDYMRCFRWLRWEAEQMANRAREDYDLHGNYWVEQLILEMIRYLEKHHFDTVPIFKAVEKMDEFRNIFDDPQGDIPFVLDKLKGIRHRLAEGVKEDEI